MPRPRTRQRLSLREAVGLYWPHLIGLVLYAPCWSVALVSGVPDRVLAIASLLLGPLVIGVAAWPFLVRRAPFTFWAVAGVGAGLLGALLSVVVFLASAQLGWLAR